MSVRRNDLGSGGKYSTCPFQFRQSDIYGRTLPLGYLIKGRISLCYSLYEDRDGGSPFP